MDPITDEERFEGVGNLLRALRRAERNWPNESDILAYLSRYSFAYQSPEQAFKDVEELHRLDLVQSRVEDIAYDVRSDAIEQFMIQRVSTGVDESDRFAIRFTINRLDALGSYQKLDSFLRSVIEQGAKSAVAQYRAREKGNKVLHSLYGLAATLEAVLVLVALSRFTSGFQTSVIAALGLIYYSSQFQRRATSTNNVRMNLTLLNELARVRFLLKDRSLDWTQHEQELLTAENAIAKEKVRYWIVTTKASVITLACVIVLLATLF